MKLGFIGAGQMASALATGILKTNKTADISVYDPDSVAVQRFAAAVGLDSHRFQECVGNNEVVEKSDFVFIAVKPQVAAAALKGLNEVTTNETVFISVVAGLTMDQLHRFLGNRQIIRTMPNTPCLIGQGVIAVAASASVHHDKLNKAKEMLAGTGLVVDVNENQLDAVTGLSGSGPAFVYMFVEALIDGGVHAGLPREISERLAIQTLIGSARLLESTGEHPGVLRNNVTSPGGTTIHGLAQLEKNGFVYAVMAAVSAASDRSRQLSEEQEY